MLVVLILYETIKEGTIQGAPSTSGSSFIQPYSASIKVSDSGSKGNPYLGLAYTSITSSIINPYSASITTTPSLTDSTHETSKDGTIDYASDNNKSFTNIHDSWGTGTDDTHFINFAGGTGSAKGDYNTGHIDTRNVFHTIGDTEYYSASFTKGASNFIDHNNFYNQTQITDGPAKEIRYFHFINYSVDFPSLEV